MHFVSDGGGGESCRGVSLLSCHRTGPPSTMGFSLTLRRKTIARLGVISVLFLAIRWLFTTQPPTDQIAHHNVIDRVTRGTDKTLDVKKYPFLQSRQGRDDRPDMLSEYVDDGMDDFWTRFQLPL